MIHAVFHPDRTVIEQFSDGQHPHGSLWLATRALELRHRHVRGAFVDGLCEPHQEPRTVCRQCAGETGYSVRGG
ncbi:hypothetical protein [Streptomyces sp. NPDC051162]|uniref:hypothetical protein n=1 Tax=Streptomyces sp. NPDC051162 TaxID=3154747 RepID=UPI00343BE544